MAQTPDLEALKSKTSAYTVVRCTRWDLRHLRSAIPGRHTYTRAHTHIRIRVHLRHTSKDWEGHGFLRDSNLDPTLSPS